MFEKIFYIIIKNKAFIFLLIILVCFQLSLVNAYGNNPVTSYREQRYKYVIGQTTWWSCGPASIATLLHYYYKIDTTEQEIIKYIAQISEDESYLVEGISLFLIKNIIKKIYDINSTGYRLKIDNLVDYFKRGGLPIIMHFTLPRNHYVVGIGVINEKYIIVADPTFGMRLLEIYSLEEDKGFKGIVLVPIPKNNHIVNAQNMQNKVINEYKRRFKRLINLRY